MILEWEIDFFCDKKRIVFENSIDMYLYPFIIEFF